MTATVNRNAVVADLPQTVPDDEHNRELVDNVHPIDWVNPEPASRYHMVVVGAGTAGLVTAAGAAGLGAKVALVERSLLGGDCLNVGCVPSKALISAARVAARARRAAEFGVRVPEVTVDFGAVMERMRRLRAGISPHDSAQRFSELGVDVFIGHGEFTGPDRIRVGEQTLRFSRACIATGARATLPPIEGLAGAGPLTNETLFSLTELPARLAVIGAGPIGVEMAQAFARFGARVTLLEQTAQILVREDRDAADTVAAALQRDGVEIVTRSEIRAIETDGNERLLRLETNGSARELRVDRVLLGVGRAPNVDGLGLEAAGVEFDTSGVRVDARLCTSNKRIYAAGDICSPYKFTHTADAMARIVIGNALFFGRSKSSALTIPWCTYTDPEIAHVGMYAHQAEQKGKAVRTFRIAMADVDRAILDGETEGFLKVHVSKGTGKILGATLVASHAGEMISEITLAMVAGAGLGTLSKTIHPYPTQAEALRKAGDAYNRTRLTPRVKRLFDFILRLRR